jgi:CubicO group peptidase (beta-lactamase class C family)
MAPPGSFWVAENMDTEGFAQTLGSLPLRHHPGTVWEYGLSTDVLGAVAERAGGASLGALMRERVFAPLGMEETGYVLPQEKLARFARPFAKDPITGASQSVEAPLRAPKMETGGAGSVSTAADYLRFAEMLRAGGILNGVRVLAPQTIAWMASDHFAGHRKSRRRHGPGLGWLWFWSDGRGAAFARRIGPYGRARCLWLVRRLGHVFWADPAERLSVVFMAHAPGELRQHYRRLINMLTYQAIEA